jgi:DNA-binding transcriptional ArsR family regulator
MSFAAVQKHVAVLERAGLVTKRRAGRQQLAHGEVTAVRSVASMLSDLEDLWRGRVQRIDDLLAASPPVSDDPRKEPQPCPSPT